MKNLKIISLIVFFIIALSTTTYLIWNISKELGEQSDWVNHTHEVITETKTLLDALKDTETGQRGYLLTKNKSYLEPYIQGKSTVKKSFDRLKNLTSDNLAQQKRLEWIDDKIRLKLDELALTIDLTNKDRYKDALAIVKQNIGKKYMDDIRELMKNFIDVEYELLDQRVEKLDIKSKNSIITVILITSTFLSISFYFIYVNMTQRQKLQEFNLTLEKKVEEKTQELLELNRDLENKVKAQIEELRENDMLMLEQSKLASMGEMIGNIAHQWRQPLSVMSTIASGIKLKSELGVNIDQKELYSNMDNLISQSKYLSKTIDDFRDFIKNDKSFDSITVKDILDSTISLFEATYKNSYIHIELDMKDDMRIIGNKNEIQQALVNIFNNAKDILIENIKDEDDRIIFISTNKLSDEKLILEILDSAGGISDDIINRIFEPYFTTKHKSMGTGLGLSMSYKIIKERHNFDIFVKNKEIVFNGKKYKGACFFVEFSNIKNT